MNLDDNFVKNEEGSVLPLPAYMIIGAFLAETIYRVYQVLSEKVKMRRTQKLLELSDLAGEGDL